MDAVFLTMGGILIPLGFYIKIERPQDDTSGTVCVLVGIFVWLIAYYIVKRKEKRESKERAEERRKLFATLDSINKELKEFNKASGDAK